MSQTVKVGIFMTVALVLLGWLILKIEDWSLFGEKGRRFEAVFESVVGLDDKAAVRVAGVRVGRVDGVRLDGSGRRARVGLLLDPALVLTEGATAAIANQGLLGDKFVELSPGPAGGAPLPEGSVLPGETPVSFDQAMEKLDEIGSSIQDAMKGLSSEDGGGIGALIDSIQATADELRAVIAENRESFGGTVKNFERFSATLAEDLPRLTAQIERVLGQVDSVVAENRGNLQEGLENVKELTASVQRSVDNLNTITDRLVKGEGTIGKLLTSDDAHNELLDALGSVEKGVETLTDTLGRAQKMKLELGLTSSYLSETEESRSAFRVDLAPQGDESKRLYRFDLVSDPYGRVQEKTTIETVTLPDGTVEETTTTRLTRDERRNEYSALFGFPFAERRGRVWIGLVENSGGAQVEYSLIPERVWLSFEAYDFSRELDLDPHLRLSALWYPWRNVFVEAGYDDPLVDDLRSPFVGFGLRWSDDDIKYLLGSIPSF
jgi:phospholipid/cholesterol/gamma-HCH transport system substrate-binding protein